MQGKASKPNKNILTKKTFEALLGWLNADRTQATEIYENIRRKLLTFFEWRGCHSPDEYADLTLDRVARHISEGKNIRTHDKYLYFHGVARNLLREYFKKNPPLPTAFFNHVSQKIAPPLEQDDDQELINLQKKCLQKLPEEERQLIIEFCFEDGLLKKLRRKAMAKHLSISENALRIKIHRIREKLWHCVETEKFKNF